MVGSSTISGNMGWARTDALGFPRNFPSRSATTDDRVRLCSPETAAAPAALTGRITDPGDLPRRGTTNASSPASSPLIVTGPAPGWVVRYSSIRRAAR